MSAYDDAIEEHDQLSPEERRRRADYLRAQIRGVPQDLIDLQRELDDDGARIRAYSHYSREERALILDGHEAGRPSEEVWAEIEQRRREQGIDDDTLLSTPAEVPESLVRLWESGQLPAPEIDPEYVVPIDPDHP